MEPEPKTVLSFGEALWDLLPDGPQLGGAPLNLAYRLCCLGDRGILVTRVGRDEFGQMAALRLGELGMETDFVQWDDRWPTGTVEVAVDGRGNPDFTIRAEVAYDRIETTYEIMELAERADAICFGSVAQRTQTSRCSLQRLISLVHDRPRFLDLNLRRDCYTWQVIEELLGLATILKLNQDEARQVAFGCDLAADPLPEFCAALMRRWPFTLCVVTLAEKGAFAMTADGTRVYEPGYEVPVVDTCGSGDAFAAGFLHAHLRGRPLRECCQLGTVLGALVATQAGATEPISTTMVDEFQSASLARVTDSTLMASTRT